MAQTGSSGVFKVGYVLLRKSTYVASSAGAPTNGTSGTLAAKAGPGSIYINATSGLMYINTNTKASPTWTLFHPSGMQLILTALSAVTVIPVRPSANYVITKGSVFGGTLAAPTATTDDGVELLITSNTAFAHTVTATGLLQTGSAFVNVATFNANAGASLGLVAYQAKWNVIYANGVSFS